RFEPEPGLDEATLWALAVAKVNRAEHFGVTRALDHHGPAGDDDPRVYVELEELYHTRMLRAALRAIGLEMTMAPPRRVTRFLVDMMASLPPAMRNVPLLVSEIAGVVGFRALLEKARALFGQAPPVAARIEQLLAALVRDEVDHVQYVRSMLDSYGLK